MKVKELLERLPQSWDEVTLEMFQKLTTTPITEDQDVFDGIQNSISVMAKILDVTEDELEELKMSELNQLGQRISFMMNPIEPAKKPSIKLKPLDQITYNDYVGYIQVKEEHLQHLHKFIKQFGVTDKTEEELLKLPVADAMGFFLSCSLQLRKYLKHSARLTRIKLLEIQMKEKLKGLLKKMKK